MSEYRVEKITDTTMWIYYVHPKTQEYNGQYVSGGIHDKTIYGTWKFRRYTY